MDTMIGCFEDIVVVRGIVEDVSAGKVVNREGDTVVVADIVADVVVDTVLDTTVDFVGGFCRGYSSGGGNSDEYLSAHSGGCPYTIR